MYHNIQCNAYITHTEFFFYLRSRPSFFQMLSIIWRICKVSISCRRSNEKHICLKKFCTGMSFNNSFYRTTNIMENCFSFTYFKIQIMHFINWTFAANYSSADPKSYLWCHIILTKKTQITISIFVHDEDVRSFRVCICPFQPQWTLFGVHDFTLVNTEKKNHE